MDSLHHWAARLKAESDLRGATSLEARAAPNLPAELAARLPVAEAYAREQMAAVSVQLARIKLSLEQALNALLLLVDYTNKVEPTRTI